MQRVCAHSVNRPYCARGPFVLDRLRKLDPGYLLYETTQRRHHPGSHLPAARRMVMSGQPPMWTWYCAPFDRLQVPVPWYGVVIR